MAALSSENDFRPIADLSYSSKANGAPVTISASAVAAVAATANAYFVTLKELFGRHQFDVFNMLGQRNMSGFVGEVFVRCFARDIVGYAKNPHADGRPDIIEVASPEARAHLENRCMLDDGHGQRYPDRSALAPFKYGGLEVKATIGNLVRDYRARAQLRHASPDLGVGRPRVDYLRSLTFWGHHRDCENLLGLYYDYYEESQGAPQIIAVMHATLVSAEDWFQVSTGHDGSKKTSNTSLTTSGRKKILGGTVLTARDARYESALQRIGVSL